MKIGISNFDWQKSVNISLVGSAVLDIDAQEKDYRQNHDISMYITY